MGIEVVYVRPLDLVRWRNDHEERRIGHICDSQRLQAERQCTVATDVLKRQRIDEKRARLP
jgi:hypothetical protein